jgi:hypothetical protein
MHTLCVNGMCLMTRSGELMPNGEKLFSERNNKRKMEEDRWFDPAFQNFINAEIATGK